MKRVAVFSVFFCLVLASCSPPGALRRMAGQDEGTGGGNAAALVDEEAFPAPETPDRPAQLLFGTVILTNEASWGLFLNRGQEEGGALVLDVLPDTPASELGMQAGDVITWIDGVTVSNHEQLLVAFRDAADTSHEMRVNKVDGSEVEIEAQLVPPDGFSLLQYLEAKIATSNDPITRYLLAEQTEDDNRAFELIRSVLAEHPTFAEGHALLARRLMDKIERDSLNGLTFEPTAEIEELTRAIDRAVELDPEAPSIYRARSQIYLSLQDGESAEADATTALGMDDRSPETHYLLGTSQLLLGNYADAIEGLHLAVQLNPFEPKYYINLALCYRSLGREPDAKSTFSAAKTLVADPLVRQRIDELAADDGTRAAN